MIKAKTTQMIRHTASGGQESVNQRVNTLTDKHSYTRWYINMVTGGDQQETRKQRLGEHYNLTKSPCWLTTFLNI